MIKSILPFAALLLLVSCQQKEKHTSSVDNIQQKVEEFIPVKLSTDLSVLTEKEQQMLPLLFEAAEIMDGLFWKQSWGNKDELLNNTSDEYLKKFLMINYGPWERLNNNQSFVNGIGTKPAGAQFYPADMTKEEFEAFDHELKSDLYTIVRRKEDKSLEVVPYSVAYKAELSRVSELVRQAAALAEDEGLKNYLTLRADALLSNDYQASDMAWMDMKTNTIDFIVGPIETYEDGLYGSKAAFESFILIKDKEWSDKLARFASLLPQLQESLPVPAEYKSEVPGSDSDLGAYDALYYAGDCNGGSKTIAINLPNDPQVHVEKGSRKLQLKNSMRAKFDNILIPISKLLILPEQQKHVTFDAFFENTMFHEVAHGLGIKQTLDGKQTVREAMKETASSIEEAKADLGSIAALEYLQEAGKYTKQEADEIAVTWAYHNLLKDKPQATQAHRVRSVMQLDFLKKKGVVSFDKNGVMDVKVEKIIPAAKEMLEEVIRVQLSETPSVAKEYIDKHFVWDETVEKAASNIKSIDKGLHGQLEMPLAEEFLAG